MVIPVRIGSLRIISNSSIKRLGEEETCGTIGVSHILASWISGILRIHSLSSRISTKLPVRNEEEKRIHYK